MTNLFTDKTPNPTRQEGQAACTIPLRRLHQAATRALEHPAPGRLVLDALGMAAPAIQPLLWQDARGREPDDDIFVDTVRRFEALLAGDPPRISAVALLEALGVLGHAWRALSTEVLREIVRQCAPPLQRLRELEVRHVLNWILDGGRPKLNPRWPSMLERAMAWQHNDEILLHLHPSQWESPLPQIQHEVFQLVPVLSTAQQLEHAALHRGALCSTHVMRRCKAGLEAWWIAVPRFRVPGLDERPSIVGLARANDQDDWTEATYVATPGWGAHAKSLATSLKHQANDASRLVRLRALAGELEAAPAGLVALATTYLRARDEP